MEHPRRSLPTYYEFLDVEFTATRGEIWFACDKWRDRWLEIANEDFTMAGRAHRMLAFVEQIRTVLSDPAKRAAYDAALANGEAYGESSNPDAYPCLSCGAKNSSTERFCGVCGAPLVRNCPECANPYYLGWQVCGQCGYNYEVAEQRAALGAEIRAQRANIDISRQAISRVTVAKETARNNKQPSCLWQMAFVAGLVMAGFGAWGASNGEMIWLFIGLPGLVMFVLSIYTRLSTAKKAVAAYDADIVARQAEYMSAETKLRALTEEFHKLDNAKTGA